jgi:SAM-dependent methyltransferase
LKVDFGKAASDYRRYRPGFPLRFFSKLTAHGVGLPNQRLLDVGTGTGALARQFSLQGCAVTALDPASELLSQATELDRLAGAHVTYRAEVIERTDLDDATFDVVTAGQCWHWFDRAVAARQVHRVLKADGAAVIAHFDWLPLGDNVVAATERLIAKHNPKWKMFGGTGLYPAWLADLSEAGFCDLEMFCFDVDLAYSREAWRGRIRASAGVAASLPQGAVDKFDEEHEELLSRQYPAEPLLVPHRCSAIIGRKRPATTLRLEARSQEVVGEPDRDGVREQHRSD